MRHVDISSDVGERPSAEGLANDAELLAVVSSANVACGGHAGDHASMTVLCELATQHGVAVGAQVSYVDREGFGRRRLDVSISVLIEQLHDQWGALANAAAISGTHISYMRPHGALYNTALVDLTVAEAVVAATPAGTPILCVGGTALAAAAIASDYPVIGEIFADRAITDEGLLVSRSEPAAVVADPEEIDRRISRWLATGTLPSRTGRDVPIPARSICIHSDTPHAVAHARRIRLVIESRGVTVAPFASTTDSGRQSAAHEA